MTKMVKIENASVGCSIDADQLAGEIRGLASGARWTFDAGATLRADGAQVREVRVDGSSVKGEIRKGDSVYTFTISVGEREGEISFHVAPVHEAARASALRFPGPFQPVGTMVSEVAIPIKLTNGVIHRPSWSESWHTTMTVAGRGGLSMPFWGLAAGSVGMLCIVETADDAEIYVDKRPGCSLTIDPIWNPSLGKLGYTRTFRLWMLPRGDYVTISKAYRAYVRQQGRFKTLAEKVAERPDVAQLLGGPYFFTGYLPFSERKFRQILRGLREMGYSHGLVGPIDLINWGAGPWLNDYQRFIQEPGFARIARDHGFVAFSWLMLEDVLEHDAMPDRSWLARTEDGGLAEGWYNGDFEYWLGCSRVLGEKQRHLRGRMDAYDAFHFDTTTAKPLFECWDDSHPMTRREDRESRRARLLEVASWGKVIGSEGGCDWAFDVYDFCSSNPRRGLETGISVPSMHVPLLGLIYHEAVVSYCWEYDPYNPSYFGGDWARQKMLYDVMAGNPPTISPVMGYFPVIRRPAPPVESRWVTWEDPVTQRLLRDALPVAQLHGRTAHVEMVDHAFLDDRGAVTRTAYKDGTEVIVNFGHEKFELSRAHSVPAQSFEVR